MDEYGFLLAIAGVLAVGAMSPGPSFVVVAQNSLSRSRADGLATAVGTGLGVALFALLAGLGVVTLLKKAPTVFTALTLIGGAYLLWIAYRIWQSASEPLITLNATEHKPRGAWPSFIQGLAVQTSNPKTAIVIAGIFAAFVPTQPPPLTVPLVVGIAFVIDFTWYAAVAFTLSNPTSKKLYGSAKGVFDRTVALFLALVGARLILGHLPF